MTGRWVVYILAGLSVVCFTTVFLIGAVRRLRSRGEEAGVPEHDDEMPALILPGDRRHVAAVFGEYAREMPELRRFADEVEDLYLIEVEK